MSGRYALLLRLLFALALVLRLLFVLWLHPARAFVYSDMQSYDYAALELLSGRSSVWHAFRPVGYSMLLALVYALTDASRTFVGVLQALMGAALVPLTASLARAAGASRGVALGIALVVATSFPLILYCGFVLTEVPSAFFLLLGLSHLMVQKRANEPLPSQMRLLRAGLYLGLAGAVRPNFLLVYPAVALYLQHAFPLRARPDEPSRGLRSVRAWLALGAGLALPLLIVCLYNGHVLGRAAGPSANGGLNFYLNFADVHTIRYQGALGEYWISPVPNGFDHSRIEHTSVPLFEDGYYYARGAAVVRAEPGVLLDALENFPEAAGIGRQLYWPNWQGHEPLLRGYARGFFALVLLPALAGLLLLLAQARRRSARPEALTLALLCATSAVPIYLFLGDPRLRVPFDPLWTLLAGLALQALGALLARRFRVGARGPTPGDRHRSP